MVATLYLCRTRRSYNFTGWSETYLHVHVRFASLSVAPLRITCGYTRLRVSFSSARLFWRLVGCPIVQPAVVYYFTSGCPIRQPFIQNFLKSFSQVLYCGVAVVFVLLDTNTIPN